MHQLNGHDSFMGLYVLYLRTPVCVDMDVFHCMCVHVLLCVFVDMIIYSLHLLFYFFFCALIGYMCNPENTQAQTPPFSFK